MLRVRQFRADKPPSSCTNLWYLIRLNQTERAQRITFKVPLCTEPTQNLLSGQSQRNWLQVSVAYWRSIMVHQSHLGFSFWTADRGTAWPSVMSPHILSDGQSSYAHMNAHTRICLHAVVCPEIPLCCQSSLCPFTVSRLRKPKKECLVHWPLSASVSERAGRWI